MVVGARPGGGEDESWRTGRSPQRAAHTLEVLVIRFRGVRESDGRSGKRHSKHCLGLGTIRALGVALHLHLRNTGQDGFGVGS